MANSVPPQVRLDVYLKAGKKCYYCGETIKWEDFTIDHVQAKSAGGKNRKSNYVCCCRDCNNAKGNMSVEQFEEFIKSLHMIMRSNQLWRVFCKHYKVTIKRKSSFLEKYREVFKKK